VARGEVGSGGDVTTTVTTLSDWPPVLHAIAARTVVKSAIRVEVIVAPRLIRGQLDCIPGGRNRNSGLFDEVPVLVAGCA